MKDKFKPEAILKQIARIQRMERGKLCRMGAGAYYNHQTRENARNVVRYVARKDVPDLQKAVNGYQQYLKPTKVYADAIIRRTRQRQIPKPLPAQKQLKNQ
jgi:hypothetical protein